jgi:hypothetical protein
MKLPRGVRNIEEALLRMIGINSSWMMKSRKLSRSQRGWLIRGILAGRKFTRPIAPVDQLTSSEFALPPRTPTIPETSEMPAAEGQEVEQKITPFDVQGGTDASGKSTGM